MSSLLDSLRRLFFPVCYKETLGYKCKHGVNNHICECDGKRI